MINGRLKAYSISTILTDVTPRTLLATLAVATALALSGCTTMTDPVPVGSDTYMMGLSARGGLTSDIELLAQTMRAAGAFCSRQGRHMELQTSSTTGTQGWTPQGNQVVFRCAA